MSGKRRQSRIFYSSWRSEDPTDSKTRFPDSGRHCVILKLYFRSMWKWNYILKLYLCSVWKWNFILKLYLRSMWKWNFILKLYIRSVWK